MRRAFLVARLAPRIAGLLDRPRPRISGLLALSDTDLLRAVAPERAEEIAVELECFAPDAERERMGRAGVVSLCRHCTSYPPMLRDLDDPPAALFALGRVEALDQLRREPAVAIVGTRRPTAYGIEVAHALGRGLGAAGVPVVSGLALGIDATAHGGCFEGGGVGLAVLAGGPDVPYPRRHHALHRRIQESGIVLSELPPGTQPYRWSFPARNRIMAAISCMTVVVEADDPSGSLITADFARDLGRCVAAVPGRVTSKAARGTNGLLKDGAVPITSTEDVLDELFGVGAQRVPAPASAVREPEDATLRRVLDAAERTGSVTAIASASALTIAQTRAALARLEADGYLVRRTLDGWERTLGPILPGP